MVIIVYVWQLEAHCLIQNREKKTSRRKSELLKSISQTVI